MKLQNVFHKFCKNESGSVIVLVALCMAVMTGMSAIVIDFGKAYSEASKLQSAMDSSALAACRALPVATSDTLKAEGVVGTAIKYAQLNGYTITSDNVHLIENNGRYMGITVSDSVVVDYFFADILGINTGTVAKSATANILPASGVAGVVPVTVTSSNLAAAIEKAQLSGMTLKFSSNSSDLVFENDTANGWYGVVQLDETQAGANDYKDALVNGYDGEITIGSILDMESGVMSGPTYSGFLERFNACPHTPKCSTSTGYVIDCPRVVTVPVIEVYDAQKKEVKVVGFASFLLDEVGGSGNQSYIKGTYLPEILASGTGSATAEDFGVYVARLTS